MFKKLIVITAAALLLSGCAAVADEKGYIAEVSETAPNAVARYSTDGLTQIAESICAGLDNGESTADIQYVITELGIEAEEAGLVISAAISNYCPR